MRRIQILSLSLFAIIAIFLNSCERFSDNQKGKVEFSMSADDGLKSFSETSADTSDVYYSWHLMISVMNENGEYVFEDEIIPLLSFGNEFITRKIELETGKYKLTKFLVINPEGKVIYAAPLEGSPRAHLVNDPLPLDFTIRPEQTTKVMPQVLVVLDYPPSDFGYAAFGFQIVNPIVAYVMAMDDNPLYMRPSAIIPAMMTIITPDGRVAKYNLKPRVNRVLIKPGYEVYQVIVENPNFPPLKMRVEAKQFIETTPENPLIFNLSGGEYITVEIQPGPENGKDAMITDLNPEKNFGDHHFFEASFLTEPVLTVMRTRRSLIHFNLNEIPKSARIENVRLVLHFEVPIWDSLYEMGRDEYMLWNDTLVLQQIVEPWEEHEVTWNNQPKTIEANQVFIPMYDHLSTNMRVYDVTCLFVPCQEIAAPNYGMMFRHLAKENIAPGGARFASSDYPIESMRPKLIIRYTLYTN